jgi:hypothetical protein
MVPAQADRRLVAPERASAAPIGRFDGRLPERHVTERELNQILRRWQRRMGLERWQIELDLEKPTESFGENDWHWAELARSNNYEEATIRLHPEWRSWSAEKAEHHLVHELVHVWTRDLEETLKLVDFHVPHAVHTLIQEAFAQRLEAAVDLIARRLVVIADEGA